MNHISIKGARAIPLFLLILVIGIGSWLTYAAAQRSRLSAPLIRAVKADRVAEVKVLLDRGADPGARDDGRPVSFWRHLLSLLGPLYGQPSRGQRLPSALTLAAATGEAKIVRLLLKYGAGPNEKGPDGRTALMYAAARGDTDMVSNLLSSGADVNLTDDHHEFL